MKPRKYGMVRCLNKLHCFMKRIQFGIPRYRKKELMFMNAKVINSDNEAKLLCTIPDCVARAAIKLVTIEYPVHP